MWQVVFAFGLRITRPRWKADNQISGLSWPFRAAERGNAVTFTSDFLDFSIINNADLASSFTALSNVLKVDTNMSLSSFRATAGGQFSADPAPTVVGFVPEPATWAMMMMIGFGLTGSSLRYRRQSPKVVFG